MLVADHTASRIAPYYTKMLGVYSIPIAIFDPSGQLHGKSDKIAQQIDIMPTVLDLIGYDKPFFAFGSSLFDDNAPKFAVNYNEGIYQLITHDYVCHFDGEKVVGFYERSDFLLEHNLVNSVKFAKEQQKLEDFFKSFLQCYGRSLKHNEMTVDANGQIIRLE